MSAVLSGVGASPTGDSSKTYDRGVCVTCERRYRPTSSHQKTCSAECRRRRYRQMEGELRERTKLMRTADEVRMLLREHESNLAGWREPNGYLVPTEPDANERALIRARLRGLIFALHWVLGAEVAEASAKVADR